VYGAAVEEMDLAVHAAEVPQVPVVDGLIG
jgi:hypothetical protein